MRNIGSLLLSFLCGLCLVIGFTRLTTSCVGPRASLGERLDDTADGLAEIQEGMLTVADLAKNLASLRQDFSAFREEAKKEADVDGDGKLSIEEKLVYLALLGAGGSGLAAQRAGKGAKQQVSELNSRIDHEREKRKLLEEELAKARRSG